MYSILSFRGHKDKEENTLHLWLRHRWSHGRRRIKIQEYKKFPRRSASMRAERVARVLHSTSAFDVLTLRF
jgi:hypothetical protein